MNTKTARKPMSPESAARWLDAHGFESKLERDGALYTRPAYALECEHLRIPQDDWTLAPLTLKGLRDWMGY